MMPQPSAAVMAISPIGGEVAAPTIIELTLFASTHFMGLARSSFPTRGSKPKTPASNARRQALNLL
jgi:hypothetical protein